MYRGNVSPTVSARSTKKATSSPSKKKRSQKSVSLTGDDDYVEPSNKMEVSYAERKIKSLARGKTSERFVDLDNVDDMGFRLNVRKTDKIDEETDKELNRVRDVVNDPHIKVDGTCIIVSIPGYAKRTGNNKALFKRQMYPEELKQLSQRRFPIIVSTFVENMAKELEMEKRVLVSENNIDESLTNVESIFSPEEDSPDRQRDDGIESDTDIL